MQFTQRPNNISHIFEKDKNINMKTSASSFYKYQVHSGHVLQWSGERTAARSISLRQEHRLRAITKQGYWFRLQSMSPIKIVLLKRRSSQLEQLPGQSCIGDRFFHLNIPLSDNTHNIKQAPQTEMYYLENVCGRI